MWRHQIILLLSVVRLVLLMALPATPAAKGSVFEETRKLLASDSFAKQEFGGAIAVNGDSIVVGTALDTGIPGSEPGSAYIFDRNQGGVDNWGLVVRLAASDGANGDEFGFSVAISGDIVVVGANLADSAVGNDSGAVYIFDRNQGGTDNWGEVKKLTASDATAGDHFGSSVAISDDTIVVGAARDNTPAGTNSGAAYVFERDLGGPDNWGEVRELAASDAITGALFGVSVAIDNDTIVIGASGAENAGIATGASYVFERDHGGADNWGEIAKLTGSDVAFDDRMGESVSISGDTTVVGARLHEDAGNASGAAFIFERNQGGVNNWGEVAELISSDAAAGDDFGDSVSISGDVLVVGARFDDDSGTASGSTYRFERNQGGADSWGEVEKLVASDAAATDRFGQAVAISNETIVVGASFDDDACPTDPSCDSGAAYVFTGTIPPSSSPTLSIPMLIPSPANLPVNVPITFTGNGQNIVATTFSVDYDETCLDFDPSDSNSDGIPDAATFSTPADFFSAVTFAAADTLGELDFSIADFSVPLANIPDGVVATIALTPTCIPTNSSIIAPITFGLEPAASFGDTAGQSVPGTTVNGSVEILQGTPGDCNDDGVIDAGDISACVLEVFDGDGNVWTETTGGTFLGSPVGCDANQDFLVDAGDFSCKILLIFNGAGACTAPLAPTARVASLRPELRFGEAQSQGSGETVTIPLTFVSHGQAIAASAFSIDYDENCLSFDPSTGLAFMLPDGITPSVSYDAADTAGELGISFLDPALPFDTLQDGTLATLTFTTKCDPGPDIVNASVGFGTEPLLSIGNTLGQSVQGTGFDGQVLITSAFFADGFESGSTSRWSNTVNAVH